MKKRCKIAAVILALFAFVGTYGCSPPSKWGEGLKVLTTTTMITDLAREIGGEKVWVVGLMAPGIDPHQYTPTGGDSALIRQSDIILYNGLHLEGSLSSLLAKNSKASALSTGLGGQDLLYSDEQEGGTEDPHIWFSVPLWKKAAIAAFEALSAADSSNTEYYRQNLDDYLQRLDDLDEYIREQVLLVPVTSRILITAHDAFRYFGHEYGFEVEGLQGLSTVVEQNTRHINQLKELILSRGIKAIFIESSVPERSVRGLIDAVKAQGGNVTIGGELYSDAIGAEGYIASYRHNIDAIVGALK